VVCIISGANTDLSRLDEAKEKSLMFKGHKNYYLLNLPNRSGIVA
jgi:threonine dehydratase